MRFLMMRASMKTLIKQSISYMPALDMGGCKLQVLKFARIQVFSRVLKKIIFCFLSSSSSSVQLNRPSHHSNWLIPAVLLSVDYIWGFISCKWSDGRLNACYCKLFSYLLSSTQQQAAWVPVMASGYGLPSYSLIVSFKGCNFAWICAFAFGFRQYACV